MRFAIKTCTLDLPYTQMLDYCVEQGVYDIEIGTGNWSGAPHIDLDAVVSSETARQAWVDEMRRRNISLCALNCAGNQLAYDWQMDVTNKTFQLAEMLGVKRIVMMSGLPAGCPGDKTPVWITTSWPPEVVDTLEYQWNDVAIPAWEKIVERAKNHGIEQIAIENHGMQLVYNPETLLRLRDAVGPMVGMNMDPSHLFWMGGDPIAAVRLLAEHDALYHVHVKDAGPTDLLPPNGVLDTKTIDKYLYRSWNYVAVGAGHDTEWWRNFFNELKKVGYDDVLSLEMEDMSMSAVEGHTRSLEVMRAALA